MKPNARYQIIFEEDKAVILDEVGQPIPVEVGTLILRALDRNYRPKASVYIGFSPTRQLWKIGVSGNFNRRASELDIVVKHVVACADIHEGRKVERTLHRLFFQERIEGEWFKLSDDDVEMLAMLPNADSIPAFIYLWAHLVEYRNVLLGPESIAKRRVLIAQVRDWLDEVERLKDESEASDSAELDS